MGNDDKFIEGPEKREEDFPDFGFDELPDEQVQKIGDTSVSEDEVIDLADIVEEETQTYRGAEETVQGLDFLTTDFERALQKESLKEAYRGDLGLVREPFEPQKETDTGLELLESDLESHPVDELGAPDEAEKVQETLVREAGFDGEVIERIAGLPRKDTGAMEKVPDRGLIGLSEDRLEAILARVVREVVEKVARETMTSIAEKVIGEAIEALRHSIESSRD